MGRSVERVFKNNSLKLNAASHTTTSWYIDTDGFLEHSPSRKPVLQGACPPEDNSGFFCGGPPSYSSEIITIIRFKHITPKISFMLLCKSGPSSHAQILSATLVQGVFESLTHIFVLDYLCYYWVIKFLYISRYSGYMSFPKYVCSNIFSYSEAYLSESRVLNFDEVQFICFFLNDS